MHPLVVGESKSVSEGEAPGACCQRTPGVGSRWLKVAKVLGSTNTPKYGSGSARRGLPGPRGARLLARRSLGQEPELKYHRACSGRYAAANVGPGACARGGRSRRIFSQPRGECGPRCSTETRGWVGWHHHTALSMLALTFLVLQRARLGEKRAADDRPRGASTARSSAGHPRLGSRRDPAVVPLAYGAEPTSSSQPPKATRRRAAAANAK